MRARVGEARERQQAARGAPDSCRGVLVILLGLRAERPEEGEGRTRLAAGRIHADFCGRFETRNSVGSLVPFGESGLPQCRLFCGSRIGCRTVRARARGAHPRTEVRGRQIGKRQQEIREIALGVDGEDRDAVDRRFLDQGDAKSSLSAPGHPHADGVREQILRIVQDRFRQSRSRVEVVAFAEVEEPKLFVGLHRAIMLC